jgi:hypothetical protein
LSQHYEAANALGRFITASGDETVINLPCMEGELAPIDCRGKQEEEVKTAQFLRSPATASCSRNLN